MKANELSVGDWVCAKMTVINGEERLTPPMRVCSIGETWICTMIDPEQGDPFDDKIEDIRPIPLTADILERNGFEKAQETEHRIVYYLSLNNEEEGMAVQINKPNCHECLQFTPMTWASPCISVRTDNCTVHMLQHFLRLAGIEKEIML